MKIHRKILLAASCAGIFFFGVILALLGTVFGVPGMRERVGISMAQQGDLFLLLYMAVFFSTLLAGPTIDRFGTKQILVWSSWAVAVALVGFSRADNFAGTALSAFLLGLGGGGLNTATNTLVSIMHEDDRGPKLNVLGVFFGLGGLCLPFATAQLSAVESLAQVFVGFAVPAGVLGILFATLQFPEPREEQKFSLLESFRVIRDRGVQLMAILLLFASGNEASIGGWTSTFLTESGADGATATLVLAAFWGSLMLGRWLASWLLRLIAKERLVILSGIGSVVGCSLLLALPSHGARAASVALIGLSFAPVFPTVLAIAGDRYTRFAGSVFSVLFAVALIGGMTFPWAIGHLAKSAGLRVGLLLPIFGAMMITLLAVAVERRGRTRTIP